MSWRKSDPDGGLLAGSRWQVYATLEDARARTNALLSVTDNDALDLDGQDGVLAVGNLKGGHDYFIRETAAPSGYDINEHIYAVDADTGMLTGVDPAAASLLGADNAVVNKRSTRVSWVKYDGGTSIGDVDGVLAGSQWEVTPDGAQQGMPVVDATVPAESVHVTRQGRPVPTLTLFRGESAQLYADVAPEEAPRNVRWESGDTAVATVDGGLVTAGTPGDTTLTVSSGADPDVKATLEVHVTGDFTLMNGDAKYEPGGAYAVTAGEHQLTLNVDADRLPYITSSDIHVARVRDGRLIAGEPGTARLSYTVAGQAREFTLTVVPEGVTAVFFATRHGDNIYTAAPGANTGEVICHDERKPVCTPELTGVRYEDNIRKARVTANDADWSVVYVPNERLEAFDYVVGATVGRYSWVTDGAPMQSVEIKASMRGPDYSNFHAPAGQIAVWMENWDISGTGVPVGMKPSRTGDVRVTDMDGNRVANTAVMSMHTGDTMKLDATVVQGTGNTDNRVYWKSTSPETATVAADGTISALKPGIADLYALSPKGVSQYVQIHVVDPDRIALYYDPEYGFDPCSADNPCVIRDKYAAYTQWSSYAQQYVVPPSQWDARDGGMSVYDTAYDTGYLMNGRPLMRVDLSRRELRDHVVVNGSNRQVYLMSRKERTVQCPTSPASARDDCVEDRGPVRQRTKRRHQHPRGRLHDLGVPVGRRKPRGPDRHRGHVRDAQPPLGALHLIRRHTPTGRRRHPRVDGRGASLPARTRHGPRRHSPGAAQTSEPRLGGRGHTPRLLPPGRCRGRHVHTHRNHGPGRVHASGTTHPLQRQGRAGVLARRAARDRLNRMDREHAHRHTGKPVRWDDARCTRWPPAGQCG